MVGSFERYLCLIRRNKPEVIAVKDTDLNRATLQVSLVNHGHREGFEEA